jgi:DNA-binding transcriptional MocR family regulator
MESLDRLEPESLPPCEHPDPIDFASLMPDESLFPVDLFREVLDHVVKREGQKLLQYGPVAGYPPLREYIAARLKRLGVPLTAEQVMVVNGSQQGLDLVFRSMIDPGDAVVVESPTYAAVLPLLAQYQAQILSVSMTPRGADVDALESYLRRGPVKLVYTMPNLHNPTGISMDSANRERLLALARRSETPLVEDDFESGLGLDENSPPLKALDQAGLVVYLGTFSKGLFPGLRLGWIVAPLGVVRVLGQAKMYSDYHTSLLLQAAVLEFCQRDYYDQHLRALGRVGTEKRRALFEALGRHLPAGTSWTEPAGGHAVWLTVPEGLDSRLRVTDALHEGVLFAPGTRFFPGRGGERHLRLSVSRVPVARIEEGVMRLGSVVERQLAAERRGAATEFTGEPAYHL